MAQLHEIEDLVFHFFAEGHLYILTHPTLESLDPFFGP